LHIKIESIIYMFLIKDNQAFHNVVQLRILQIITIQHLSIIYNILFYNVV
jgi:hypothetical protein